MRLPTLEEIGLMIIDSGGLEIRDVDEGEELFVYSSANRGPGYVSIKGLVGQPPVTKSLTIQLALKLLENDIDFDFIAGNATGGMVPGWQLRNDLEYLTGNVVPYVYVRGTRKIGGHKDYFTGDRNNPLIERDMKALVFEELVNFAQTTCNSAIVLRDVGYGANNAGTILSYENPQALERLANTGVTLTSLITLPTLLDIAEEKEKFDPRVIKDYRRFLEGPAEWQLEKGLVVPEATAQRAEKMGYRMRVLGRDEALRLGAPKDQLDDGFVYWVQE